MSCRASTLSTSIDKLIVVESLSPDIQRLPLEILGQICTHLNRNDLAIFARTCKAANTASERQLWQHLIIPNESNTPPWYQLRYRASYEANMTSEAHLKLVHRLIGRPDIAQAVRQLTIPAGRMYSDRLSDVINLVGPNLRRVDFVHNSENYVASQTYDPCRVGLDQVFKLVNPMHQVTHMRLALPAWQWVSSWKYALTATPGLQELRIGPLGAFGGIPTLAKYTLANSPSLPSLSLLSIEQMCTALEPAIINLIQTSTCHTIRLWLDDPEGSWDSGKDFRDFLVEWKDRLNLEIGLPSADQDEEDWLEGKKIKREDMMDQDYIMEIWMSGLMSCLPTLVFLIVLFCVIHVTVVMRNDLVYLK